MEINKTTENSVATVFISGEVDSTNVMEFENELKSMVEGEAKVVIDLEELEYVSSAGLRVFLLIQKMFGQGDALTIINVNEEVDDIFKVTGFSKLLNIRFMII